MMMMMMMMMKFVCEPGLGFFHGIDVVLLHNVVLLRRLYVSPRCKTLGLSRRCLRTQVPV